MSRIRFPGRATVLLMLAAALVVAAPAPANLLVNGSFEEGPDPGIFLPLDPGATDIVGWVVIRGNVDYVGSWWQSADGARSLDLDGTPGFGGVEQTFATIPGKRYGVTFYLAGNPGEPPRVKNMRVSATGQHADFTFDTEGYWWSDLGWVERQWSFVAAGAKTTLQFYSLDSPEECEGLGGPALDDVRVWRQTVPADTRSWGEFQALYR